jgi:hypothetical protein
MVNGAGRASLSRFRRAVGLEFEQVISTVHLLIRHGPTPTEFNTARKKSCEVVTNST